MTNDLRATAERVIRSSGGDESLFSIYCTTMATDALRKHAADCGALAEHILTSHPPDGETEIDEAWLLSIGFEHDDEWGAIYIYGYKSFPLSIEDNDGLWRYGSALIPPPITRSDLHRLCAALGIPLKEEKEA